MKTMIRYGVAYMLPGYTPDVLDSHRYCQPHDNVVKSNINMKRKADKLRNLAGNPNVRVV
jgi:hypothetical protein